MAVALFLAGLMLTGIAADAGARLSDGGLTFYLEREEYGVGTSAGRGEVAHCAKALPGDRSHNP
jgi:hypothetical protein